MTLEEVKNGVKVEDVLKAHGVRKRGGKWFCPFHQDRHPSLVVKKRPQGDTWRCYGCGKFGDVFDLISCLEGKSLGEVLREFDITPRRRPRRRKHPSPPRWARTAKALERAKGHVDTAAAIIAFVAALERERQDGSKTPHA